MGKLREAKQTQINFKAKEITMDKRKMEIKKTVQGITGNRVTVGENRNSYTISNKDSHLDNGFGKYIDALKSVFTVIRLDGGSFEILK